MFVGLAVAFLWDSVPVIKTNVHAALDPTLGALLNWNLHIGFILFVAVMTLLTTIAQKYMTDQDSLKQIKEEQKKLQEEMKKHKDDQTKLMDLQRQQLELSMKMMPMTMRPAIVTSIPFILLLRWFGDYFAILPVAKIIGLFSTQGSFLFPAWIWAYILMSIFFSSIFRKYMKVH
jgi:uncharacterized membrane protein (DUF106 family)